MLTFGGIKAAWQKDWWRRDAGLCSLVGWIDLSMWQHCGTFLVRVYEGSTASPVHSAPMYCTSY